MQDKPSKKDFFVINAKENVMRRIVITIIPLPHSPTPNSLALVSFFSVLWLIVGDYVPFGFSAGGRVLLHMDSSRLLILGVLLRSSSDLPRLSFFIMFIVSNSCIFLSYWMKFFYYQKKKIEGFGLRCSNYILLLKIRYFPS